MTRINPFVIQVRNHSLLEIYGMLGLLFWDILILSSASHSNAFLG